MIFVVRLKFNAAVLSRLRILTEIFGSKDYVVGGCGGDCALPGSVEYQSLHSDNIWQEPVRRWNLVCIITEPNLDILLLTSCERVVSSTTRRRSTQSGTTRCQWSPSILQCRTSPRKTAPSAKSPGVHAGMLATALWYYLLQARWHDDKPAVPRWQDA